mmetsp:Transcript_8506/g.13444  ORF Transcript_8506/g.13444 Transcript_8506/m.13444 type:complete len:84 (-) Transcript_8506:248-499(-)
MFKVGKRENLHAAPCTLMHQSQIYPFLYSAVLLVISHIPKKSNKEPNAFLSLTASAEPTHASISSGPMCLPIILPDAEWLPLL